MQKSFNTTLKMETLLTNTCTHLDQKSKLFKTDSIATETKELLQRNLHQKMSFFYKMGFWKVYK